jgi:hypothetical protein
MIRILKLGNPFVCPVLPPAHCDTVSLGPGRGDETFMLNLFNAKFTVKQPPVSIFFSAMRFGTMGRQDSNPGLSPSWSFHEIGDASQPPCKFLQGVAHSLYQFYDGNAAASFHPISESKIFNATVSF